MWSVVWTPCIYVCMCVCMYVCVCMCVYVCMYVCMYVCVYVCVYVCTCMCMYVCMCVCMYVYICMCMYFYFITDPLSQIEYFVKIRSEVWEMKYGEREVHHHSHYVFVWFTICADSTYWNALSRGSIADDCHGFAENCCTCVIRILLFALFKVNTAERNIAYPLPRTQELIFDTVQNLADVWCICWRRLCERSRREPRYWRSVQHLLLVLLALVSTCYSTPFLSPWPIHL